MGVCKRDGTESDSVTYCYSSTQLAQINPRSPLSGESTAAQGVDQALCIYKKNAFFRVRSIRYHLLFRNLIPNLIYIILGGLLHGCRFTIPIDIFYKRWRKTL